MSKIDVAEFFDTLKAKQATGQATEHSYRPALEKLLKSINPSLTVINEPRRIACGSPDFVIMRGDIPVGYVEAKDIDVDIRNFKGANQGQFERYKDGIPNLIYTNGLDFDFYRHDGEGNSQRIADVKIGDYLFPLAPSPSKFPVLETLLYEFVSQNSQAQTITSSNKLAKIMAGKAKLIRDALGRALVADEKDESDLAAQYLGFKDTLIHDITKEGFADIYAETIVYGMFAARYHDPTPKNFSRQEALELLPKSNPFLRKLFTFIAAHDLDEGIRWVIDDLATIFQATRVDNIMHRWSDANDKRDPFLHFYETFLAEYNPSKRKSRGVWYTPEPVVNFIVRAVDDVLKTEFDEPLGLASTNKITVDVPTGEFKEVGKKGKKKRVPVTKKEELHRVQILDPATGTGTFLAEVIRQIEPRIKAVDEGGWSNYVEHDLKPRLHGFELLMASYSMCHLKLDMMLTETGYKAPEKPNRLSVWLTNSLEEPQEDVRDLLMARWLSDEAQGANAVKQDKPIMCIIGNPPYSGISQNDSDFADALVEKYKYVDGVHFSERKHWLNDDYVKFISFSEQMIDANKEGILGFITNHGYLNNPTFRGMRWHLLKTFDNIYIIDLHGNSKRKEVAPDGSKDENVFDIQTGVAIIIAVKKQTSRSELANVYRKDFWGKRKLKYQQLNTSDYLDGILIQPSLPQFPFYKQDKKLKAVYLTGFGVDNLFSENVTGVVTARDHLAISNTKNGLIRKINRFLDVDRTDSEIRQQFFSHKKAGKYLQGDTRGWKIHDVRRSTVIENLESKIEKISYRPFDTKFAVYDESITDWARGKFYQHYHDDQNIGLVTARSNKNPVPDHFIATKHMSEAKFGESSTQSKNFPLYLYPDENDLDQTRRVNMDEAIRADIEKAVMGKDYTSRPEGFDRKRAEAGAMAASPRPSSPDATTSPQDEVNTQRPNEVDIFDYIYGVLHCPAYRETYAEFLKIDFPRVPYPSSPQEFWDIAAKGGELRNLHLMDGVDPGMAYPFKGEGDGVVGTIGKKSYAMGDDETGSVFINDTQYFVGVPKTAWEFYIGGYQPAQKWLKDRKGRELTFDDRMHYRKIIHILMETDRIMKTITMDLDS